MTEMSHGLAGGVVADVRACVGWKEWAMCEGEKRTEYVLLA